MWSSLKSALPSNKVVVIRQKSPIAALSTTTMSMAIMHPGWNDSEVQKLLEAASREGQWLRAVRYMSRVLDLTSSLVPFAGSSSTKDPIGILVKTLEAFAVDAHNPEGIARLRNKLSHLTKEVAVVPASSPQSIQVRDQLSRCLRKTSTNLDKLLDRPNLQYQDIARAINDCYQDILFYLHIYTTRTARHPYYEFNELQAILNARNPALTFITFVDPFDNRHVILMPASVQELMGTIENLYTQNTQRNRILQHCVAHGHFAIHVADGGQVKQILKTEDLEMRAQPNITMLMRIKHFQIRTSAKFECPICHATIGNSEDALHGIIECPHCERQLPITETEHSMDNKVQDTETLSGDDWAIIRNISIEGQTNTERDSAPSPTIDLDHGVESTQENTASTGHEQTTGTVDTTLEGIEDNQTHARPFLSVQSIETQTEGVSSESDIIVTVGIPEEPSETLSWADTSISPTTSRSIQRLSLYSARSLIDGGLDHFSDQTSEYQAQKMFGTKITSRSDGPRLKAENERNRVSLSTGGFDGNSVLSVESFETASEHPLESPGLTPFLIRESPPLSGSPSHEEESVESGDPITNSKIHPLYNVSFMSGMHSALISESVISFTTNFVQHDDDIRVGLHTLYLRSDPAALHNSYERQRRVHEQMENIRASAPQLLISSSSTLREHPLSVPSIKTRDLEQVVKDVFTWLYTSTSSHSIMWLFDEHEEDLSRTSLIAQCLADFLADRQDLTASYFYATRSPSSQTGDSPPGTDTRDNPPSIIPTIASQLARRIPEIEMPVASMAAHDQWIFHLNLDEQIQKLIVDPLEAASKIITERSYRFPRLLLIHGLEDCNDTYFQELFLSAVGKSLAVLQQSVPQKLILLGRHTRHLRKFFLKPELQEIVRLRRLPVS